MPTLVTDILLSLLVILIQTTVVRFLAVVDILPDLPLIWLVYLSIRRGQIPGTVFGFAVGLTLDMLSGPDGMLGLGAPTKTVAGFLAGYFYDENKMWQRLAGYQFVMAVFVVSLVHHALYFLILLQGTTITASGAFLRYGLPTAAYTALAALLPMFVLARYHRN